MKRKAGRQKMAKAPAAPAPSKAVTKTEKSNLPAFMKGSGGSGLSGIDDSDTEIPRLKLIQAISPEVETHGVKPGEWFHNVAEVAVGMELTITPIFVFKSHILWRPRKDGGGILARAPDGVHWSPADREFDVKLDSGKKVKWKTTSLVKDSGLDEWGSSDPDNKDSQPAATKMINVVAWIHEHPELSPAVITLQRGSMKVGRKLAGKLRMSAAPAYGMIFDLNSEKTKSDSGDYFIPTFRGNGFVQDEDVFRDFEARSDALAKTGVKVRDEEGLGGEDEGGASRNDDDDEDEKPGKRKKF